MRKIGHGPLNSRDLDLNNKMKNQIPMIFMDQERLFNYIKKSLQVPMIKIQVLFQQIVQIQYKEQKGLMVESFLGRVNIKSYSLG
jgi:hypothetical protein